MLKDTEVKDLLKLISEKMKAVKKGGAHEADWGPLYKKAKEHAEEIEVHACGNFPEKLIGKNFPNELNEEKDYRKTSFQPITKPYWKKAMRTIARVWAEQNYSIDWGNDEKVKKYFLEEFPVGNNAINFFKTIVTEWKIAEPNGVLALSLDIPTKQNEAGETIADDAIEVSPYATVYECEDVMLYEHNIYCLVLSDEKSIVRFNDRNEKSGLVFYLYDDTNIYRIAQVGKKVDWNFASEIYYPHNLESLPVWKLQGTPEEVIQEEIYYESYFAPALPHLNESVIIHSTNKGVRNKVSYPTRVYYDQPCGNAECSGGKVWTGEGADAKQVNCGTCKGTGSIRFSPFTDYVHQLPSATKDVGVSDVAFPGFGYVSPDGAIIKDNEEVIDKYLQTAFTFLNIEVMSGNQKGLNDPTATKSKIDRDEQYITMLDIANELFLLLKKFLGAAYQVRYNSESTITVKAPTIFDLISPDELMTRIGEAKKAGVSGMAIAEMVVQYYEQEYGGLIARKAKIAQYCDVLFVTDDTSIAIMQTNGNIEKWQVLLHVNFEPFINELVNENVDLMATELKELNDKLMIKAKAKENELNAGKHSAENIIKGIAAPAAGGGGIGRKSEMKQIDGAQRQLYFGENGGQYYIADSGNKIYV